MKRFLSILLALAVGFTFTFGSAMSAFAADYTVSSARPVLDAEVTKYTNMVGAAKVLALSGLTYNDETGLCTDTGLNAYNKKAVDAAADAVESAAKDALVAVEEEQLVAISTTPTDDLTDAKKAITEAVTKYNTNKDLTTAAGFLAALKADTLTLKKSYEATQYDAVRAAIAKDFVVADYPNEGEFKDTTDTIAGKYTAQEVVAKALAEADKALTEAKKAVTVAEAANAANEATYTTATAAYLAVYNPGTKLGTLTVYIAKFKDGVNEVKSNADIAEEKEAAAKTTAAAVAELKAYALGDFYDNYKDNFDALYTDIKDVDDHDEILYVEDKAVNSTKATVLGVAVAKKGTPTDAEKKAVISALYGKINSTLVIAEKAAYAGADVAAMYDDADAKVFLATIKNAEIIADKYADVVKYAEGLKAQYKYGKKVYDDAKVDKVLEVSEDVVYEDFGAAALDTAEKYFEDAIAVAYPKEVAPTLAYLEIDADKTIAAKLAKARTDAKALFDGAIVTSGVDATPEADKVYKKELYDATSKDENGKTYDQIKGIAHNAIDAAETFVAIDEALAAARTSLGQLLLAKDKTAVDAARTSYKASFGAYVTQQQTVLGVDYRAASFTNVKTAGDAAIDAGNTVEAVKAAYDAAVASVAAIKKSAEIKDLETAVEAQIKKLPYGTQITAADKAAVEAARTAYNELAATFGSNAFSLNENPAAVAPYTKLKDAEEAIEKIDSTDLAKKVEATAKKIDEIAAPNTDAGAAAVVALKEEVLALVAEIEEFNENALVAANKIPVNAGDGKTVVDFVGAIKNAEVYLVGKAIATLPVTITENDADAVKAARAAYDALTDVQKSEIENEGLLEVLENAEANLEAVLETLSKVTADDVKADLQGLKVKVTAKKNSKGNVKLTASVVDRATGDAADFTAIAGAGYVVKYGFYKATKKSGTFKKMTAKDETTMVSTSGKKGQKLYYKVKVLVYDAEGNFVAQTYSSDSNTPSVTK